LHFAPDSEDTLEFLVDLINTMPGASRSGTDELVDRANFDALFAKHLYSGRFDRDEAEMQEVRETRDRLRRVWSMPLDEQVVEVNAMMRDAGAMPFLIKHDQTDWHLHATPPDAPLAERIRVEAGLALADIIRSHETGRLRECEAYDCTGVLVDFSRNGSKRFCSVRCGNRMNMIAYRERQAEES
jgi:predicted RNA-binding Zn ribbon-like protein